MTPKEKAKELVDWFRNIGFDDYESKICANKCVDEKIKERNILDALYIITYNVNRLSDNTLEEVKQEINKL